MINRFFILIVGYFLFISTATANSSNFTGETLSLSIDFPTIGTIFAGPYNSVVGDNVEFGPSGSRGTRYVVSVDIDISSNSIYFDYSSSGSGVFSSGAFNGYVFTDVNDSVSDIIDVRIDFDETTLDLEESMVSFNENQIFVNGASLQHNPNSRIKLDVDFASSDDEGMCFPIKTSNDKVAIICL